MNINMQGVARYFFIALLYIFSIPIKADALEYEFQDILEYTNDDECSEGNHCLLSPYLAVAVFSDRKIKGRQVGVVLQDYFYCNEDNDEVYQVPVGFETDFMSIPELAQFAIRPNDFMEAKVIHDWLYAVGKKGKRKQADKVFYAILKEQGASLVKREAMYRAVRWGGKKAYGADHEIKIINLETMEVIMPSPVQRPDTAVVARIDCGDAKQFEKLRKKLSSGYYFQSQQNRFFEHTGFVREKSANK